MRRGENRTTKTTLRSERSSALQKGLTGPTLLEMYDYPTNQEFRGFQVYYRAISQSVRRAPEDNSSEVGGPHVSVHRQDLHEPGQEPRPSRETDHDDRNLCASVPGHSYPEGTGCASESVGWMDKGEAPAPLQKPDPGPTYWRRATIRLAGDSE